jgi:Fur family ferric uptake transcriptional regulator
LQELRKVDTHPTADEIYSMVRSVVPHISMGTVYRNLEILSEKGFVDKLEFGGQRRFDGNVKKHYHIQCLGCGAVDDVSKNLINNFEISPDKVHEYRIQGYRLLFFGICNECNSRGFLPPHEMEKLNVSK